MKSGCPERREKRRSTFQVPRASRPPCSFQSRDICILYASLRISVPTCRCTDCIKSCVLGKLLFIAIRWWTSSRSLLGHTEAHKPSLVKWLQVAPLSGKPWGLSRSVPNFAQILFNTKWSNSCSSLFLGLKFFETSSIFRWCAVPHPFLPEDELSPHQCSTDLSSLPVARSLTMLQSLPVARSLMMLRSPLWWKFEDLLTQVASSFVFWWRYRVIVRVGILLVICIRNLCWAAFASRSPMKRKFSDTLIPKFRTNTVQYQMLLPDYWRDVALRLQHTM